MFCPNCGKKIEKTRFCKYCGVKIEKHIEKNNILKYLSKYRKYSYKILLIIIIILFIINVSRYFSSESMWPDEALYTWYGYKLSITPSYFLDSELWKYHPPFFSIIIAIFNLFFPKIIAAKVTIIIFGVTGIIFIYLLGKELFNKTIGIMAAILLSFNHLYWFLTNRILIDQPLTVMVLITIYFIHRWKQTNKNNFLFVSIIFAFLTLFTKAPGAMIIVFLVLFFLYLGFIEKTRYFKYQNTILILFLITIFLIINLFIVFKINPFGFDFYNLLKPKFPKVDFVYLTLWYSLPFLLIGLFFSLYYRKPGHYFLLIYLISTTGFRYLIGSDLPRYYLTSLPAIALLISLGITEIGTIIKQISRIKIPSYVYIIFVILLIIPNLIQGGNLNKTKSYTYTGFNEAADFIKENRNANFFVGSNRALRLYSGLDYEENNGPLVYFPQNQFGFEKAIDNYKNLYLITDIWEYTQPSYLYPLRQEKAQYLQSLGFQLIKVIEKPYPTQQGLQNIPVVYIFKKTQTQAQ